MNEKRKEFYKKHVEQFTSDDEIDLMIFLNVNFDFYNHNFFSVQLGMM